MQVQCADSLPDGGVRVLTAFFKMSITGEEAGAEADDRDIDLQEAFHKVKDGVSEHKELMKMNEEHQEQLKEIEAMIDQCLDHSNLIKEVKKGCNERLRNLRRACVRLEDDIQDNDASFRMEGNIPKQVHLGLLREIIHMKDQKEMVSKMHLVGEQESDHVSRVENSFCHQIYDLKCYKNAVIRAHDEKYADKKKQLQEEAVEDWLKTDVGKAYQSRYGNPLHAQKRPEAQNRSYQEWDYGLQEDADTAPDEVDENMTDSQEKSTSSFDPPSQVTDAAAGEELEDSAPAQDTDPLAEEDMHGEAAPEEYGYVEPRMVYKNMTDSQEKPTSSCDPPAQDTEAAAGEDVNKDGAPAQDTEAAAGEDVNKDGAPAQDTKRGANQDLDGAALPKRPRLDDTEESAWGMALLPGGKRRKLTGSAYTFGREDETTHPIRGEKIDILSVEFSVPTDVSRNHFTIEKEGTCVKVYNNHVNAIKVNMKNVPRSAEINLSQGENEITLGQKTPVVVKVLLFGSPCASADPPSDTGSTEEEDWNPVDRSEGTKTLSSAESKKVNEQLRGMIEALTYIGRVTGEQRAAISCRDAYDRLPRQAWFPSKKPISIAEWDDFLYELQKDRSALEFLLKEYAPGVEVRPLPKQVELDDDGFPVDTNVTNAADLDYLTSGRKAN